MTHPTNPRKKEEEENEAARIFDLLNDHEKMEWVTQDTINSERSLGDDLHKEADEERAYLEGYRLMEERDADADQSNRLLMEHLTDHQQEDLPF